MNVHHEMRSIFFQFHRQTEVLTDIHTQIYRHLYRDGVTRSSADEELQDEIE